MKLNTRELPAVEFTRKLPEWLGPGGECFISFKARAGGAVNPAFTLGADRVKVAYEIAARRLARIEDDEAYIVAQNEALQARTLQWFGEMYDACVLSWETNIQSAGKPLKPTRENFLALASEKINPITAAITDFQTAVMQAGLDAAKADEEALKN